MDTLIMNKTWIEASHCEANRCRQSSWIGKLGRSDYLDTIGLFETGWIIYDFDVYNEKDEYEYPT